MTRPYLVGYTDEWSVRPGEEVAVMLAAHQDLTAGLDLVRMGAGQPDGEVREVAVVPFGEAVVHPQPGHIGSCIRVEGAAHLGVETSLVAAAAVMPTRPGHGPQAVLSQGEAGAGAHWCLGLDRDGHPHLSVTVEGTTTSVRGAHPLVAGAWYLLAGGATPAGELTVVARPLGSTPAWRTAPSAAVRTSVGHADGPTPLLVDGAPLYIAASADGGRGWHRCFDGKVEAPALYDAHLDEPLIDLLVTGPALGGSLLAAWDLGVGDGTPTSSVIPAVAGPAGLDLRGDCVNSPTRAVTGHAWSGVDHDVRRAPAEYGAIHFHSDDLDDCHWAVAAHVALPDELPSGVYAIRVRSEGLVDRLPLFVRPTRPTSDVALLVPTASYLAYANDHPISDGDMAEAVAGSTPVMRDVDLLLHEHREWGLSCYDRHVDGSGVVHSSRRRPVLNMRPTHRYHVGAWQLPADLGLVSWLDEEGIAVDVLTDDDLHAQGRELLAPYTTVLTGTHPEYSTTRMLDSIEEWLDDGGRLVYLGANGFYWRTAYDPERPWVVEVRRGQAGSRAWESGPGEDHLQSTGERAGLWRHLGRPPQRLTGVGYAAQGFDRCGHYRLAPDSADPRAAFVVAGLDGPTFGHSGRIGGGAAGQEIDRYDVALGTPHDALLIATSEALGDGYHRCVEELGFTVAGTSAMHDHQVRADVVYHVRPSGGAVFCTGSIAWSAALGVDPGVDRITRNVIERFRDPAPLDW